MFHNGDKFELHLEGRAHQEEVRENFGAEGAHEEGRRCLKWRRAGSSTDRVGGNSGGGGSCRYLGQTLERAWIQIQTAQL